MLHRLDLEKHPSNNHSLNHDAWKPLDLGRLPKLSKAQDQSQCYPCSHVPRNQTNIAQCDQQKPQCGKCSKRGLTCPGYRGKLFFQHVFTQTGNPEDGPGEIQSGLEVDLSPEVALPPTINAAPQIRQQISSSYMDSWFPSTNLPEPGTDIYYPVGDWNWLFTNFLQLSSNSPMLEEAVVAVSSISLGKMNRDDSLVHRGVASYNQSIRLMSNMIQQNMLTEELLFATVTFQMIEVSEMILLGASTNINKLLIPFLAFRLSIVLMASELLSRI